MVFIVLETWPDAEDTFPVMDEDTGNVKVFDTILEAEMEATDCQRPKIVEIEN
jgi:hypothetical protein